MSNHWADRYRTRKYDKAKYNCGHLVIDIQRDIYNRVVDLPVEMTDYNWSDLTDVIIEETAKQATKVDQPKEGDVVLFQNGPKLKHVGVYIVYNGTPCCIHNLAKAGVCIHPISAFGKGMLSHLAVEGYYRVG